MTKTKEQIEQVQVELDRVLGLHGDFKSFHEGYAVILEEVDELWAEVKKKAAERSKARIYEESKQLAAMAVKMMILSDDSRNYPLSTQKLPETPQRPAAIMNNTDPVAEHVARFNLGIEVNKLPWRANTRGEWVFENLKSPTVDALRALLKDKQSIELGAYQYSISGKDGKYFINRKRVSK